MCGLWGFITANGAPADASIINALALEARKRGPHSWGITDTESLLRHFPHPYKDGEGTYSAPVLLGHARLATTGEPGVDPQPLKRGRVYVTHNGVVPDHATKAKALCLKLAGTNDSETIAALVETYTGPLELRVKHAIRALLSDGNHALVVSDGNGCVLVVHGQPMHARRTEDGTYYCSLPFAESEPLERGVYAYGGASAPRHQHPLSEVTWVSPELLHGNNYNPNRVFGPEMKLLKTSILEDGWTQPVVARQDGEIVDGFHRWTLASTDAEIRTASKNLVPVVFIRPGAEAHQMMSTVRHNRARGQHGVLKMSEIVRSLAASGLSEADVCARLGMESEEYRRLEDQRAMPARAGKDHFGKAWKPVKG